MHYRTNHVARKLGMRTGTLALVAALAACSGSHDESAGAVAGGPNGGGSIGSPDVTDGKPGGKGTRGSGFGFHDGDPGAEEMPPPPTITPTGYLLLAEEQLARAQALVSSDDPRWQSFKNQTDKWLGNLEIHMASPENGAMMYRLTGDPSYAATAYEFAVVMHGQDIRGGSYLEFGNLMRHSAMVLNLCGDALSAEQKATLVEYLATSTDELWFDNQGSGWGLEDSGNNYHMAFLQGTAYAGYALREAGDPRGQEYIDMVYDKLQKEGGVFDHLAGAAAGGAWHEGINYGERSMQRLADALAVIASMDGKNFFYELPFWREVIYFSAYALQNDLQSLDPSGDLARDTAMRVTPAMRDYLQTIATFLPEMEARRLATWMANEVSGDYETPGFRIHAYRELALGLDGDGTSSEEAGLPLGYYAQGHGWLNFRAGWQPDDVSVTVSAPYVHDQSHQHMDAGSFVMFKNGWQALDATQMSNTGLSWSSASHNTIHVQNAEFRGGEIGGVIGAIDTGSYGYVGVDATKQYRHRPDGGEVYTMLDELTRELVYLRPGVLVVYDRVDAKAGHVYDWRLHTAIAPSATGDRYEAVSHGQRLAVQKLLGGAQSVSSDSDLPDFPSAAFRLTTAATGEVSRFLHVVSLDETSAPVPTAETISGTGVAGALVDDHAVVFSSEPFGATPASLTYTVPSQAGRTHLLANQDGPVTVSVQTNGSETTVTVTPGGDTQPNEAGVVEITE